MRKLTTPFSHLRNIFWKSYQKNFASARKTLVILGTGWGSYSVLKTINKQLYDVIVVSPRNHFLFTPLLCSTTTGTLEFRSIIEPVRNSGFRQTNHFHQAEATSVDLNKKQLMCSSVFHPHLTYALNYDKLVIGIGALNNTFNVHGVNEYAFFLKELSHARQIRNRILSNFELAVQPEIDEEEQKRLLHTVIVGGGPTGIEFGAELYDFFVQDVSRLYSKCANLVQVTLIESNKILSSFDKRLQSYAEKKIKERDRFNLVQSSVTGILFSFVVGGCCLVSVEVKTNSVTLVDGKVLPCGLVVWSTGLAPRPFTHHLDVPKNKQGQILTNEYLQVLGDSSGCAYALGDCADIQNLPLPCTAQVAERQGRYLAHCLNIVTSVNQLEPFQFKSMGMLAYIGGYKALSDLPEMKLQGFPSWFLWRSAYLTRLGSWRLRMQVPMDWLKTLLFGRDISRF